MRVEKELENLQSDLLAGICVHKGNTDEQCKSIREAVNLHRQALAELESDHRPQTTDSRPKPPVLSKVEGTEFDIPTELWERFVSIKDPDISNIVDDVRNYIDRLNSELRTKNLKLSSQAERIEALLNRSASQECPKCGTIIKCV